MRKRDFLPPLIFFAVCELTVMAWFYYKGGSALMIPAATLGFFAACRSNFMKRYQGAKP